MHIIQEQMDAYHPRADECILSKSISQEFTRSKNELVFRKKAKSGPGVVWMEMTEVPVG